MRLIDADKLLEPGYTDMFDAPIRFAMVSRYAIESAPTVKAIPIEWILKWACEFIDPNSEGYKMAMELVHDWRKENEKDI